MSFGLIMGSGPTGMSLGAAGKAVNGYLSPDPFTPKPLGSDGLSGFLANPGGLLGANARNRLTGAIPGGLVSMRNTLISTKV